MIEDDLRTAFTSRAAASPPTPGLTETVLRRGRRARTRRRASAAGMAAVAAVAFVGVVAGLNGADRSTPRVATSLDGPPRAPLYTGQDPTMLTTWSGGLRRDLPVDAVPVHALRDGAVLVVLPGAQPGLSLLDADGSLRPLVTGLSDSRVAVAPDGDRVTVVSGTDRQRVLQELAVPSGRVLRSVLLAEPLVAASDPVLPVAYSDGAVLLTAGEGDRQRALLWEPGDEQVVAPLDGYAQALGAAAGRGAFRTNDDDRCRTEIARLATGGRTWRLCREVFTAFSPDGQYVLARNAIGDGLVVRDATDGELVREVNVPESVRASGWDNSLATLHTTVDGARTVVVRCEVSGSRCRTAATFEGVARIPQPVPVLAP